MPKRSTCRSRSTRWSPSPSFLILKTAVSCLASAIGFSGHASRKIGVTRQRWDGRRMDGVIRSIALLVVVVAAAFLWEDKQHPVGVVRRRRSLPVEELPMEEENVVHPLCQNPWVVNHKNQSKKSDGAMVWIRQSWRHTETNWRGG